MSLDDCAISMLGSFPICCQLPIPEAASQPPDEWWTAMMMTVPRSAAEGGVLAWARLLHLVPLAPPQCSAYRLQQLLGFRCELALQSALQGLLQRLLALSGFLKL